MERKLSVSYLKSVSGSSSLARLSFSSDASSLSKAHHSLGTVSGPPPRPFTSSSVSSRVSFLLSHRCTPGYPICFSCSSCLYSNTVTFSFCHLWTLSIADIHPFSSCFPPFHPAGAVTSPFCLDWSMLCVCVTMAVGYPQFNTWNVIYIFFWLNFDCLGVTNYFIFHCLAFYISPKYKASLVRHAGLTKMLLHSQLQHLCQYSQYS